MDGLRCLSYVIALRNTFKFLVQRADNTLLRLMKSPAVPNRPKQGGFTMVEIVAGIVISVIVAAYAVPRMLGPSDFAAKVTADSVLAAVHYAQTLAQRQGMATSAVFANSPGIPLVTSGLSVNQSGVHVTFSAQNYNGTNTANDLYNALLNPGVTFVPASGVIAYSASGVLTAGSGSYTIAGAGMPSVKIKVEPTGFAHFE